MSCQSAPENICWRMYDLWTLLRSHKSLLGRDGPLCHLRLRPTNNRVMRNATMNLINSMHCQVVKQL